MNNQYPYGMYQPQNQMQFGNTLNWVQGVEGGKAFQIRPNSNALLLDSENDGIFYIKTSDNVGMCNMRTFKYEEITETPSTAKVDLSEYVRKDELNALIKQMITPEVKNEPVISANADTAGVTKPLIKR